MPPLLNGQLASTKVGLSLEGELLVFGGRAKRVQIGYIGRGRHDGGG